MVDYEQLYKSLLTELIGLEFPLEDKEQAKKALLRYMEWWSEEYYCAGWLSGLEKTIFERDETARWLRKMAGGYWTWNEDWENEPESKGELRFKKFIEDES